MTNLHYIPQTDSTNNRIKQMLEEGEELSDGYTLYTFFQTAGRGQQGNSWESENGKNLLFSTFIRPKELPAADQFRLSMLIPLAILNVISPLIKEKATIKWPNDVYVGDRKLAGILIENTLSGGNVATSVAGVGINVNQLEFHTAPNPVSLKALTGKDYDLHWLMEEIYAEIRHLLPLLKHPDRLLQAYMENLYRAKGYHPYVEREVSLEPVSIVQGSDDNQFLAEIADIDSNGCLCLRLQDNSIRHYHFKQILFVIPS